MRQTIAAAQKMALESDEKSPARREPVRVKDGVINDL